MSREFLRKLIQHKEIQDIPVLHIIKIVVAIEEIREEENANEK